MLKNIGFRIIALFIMICPVIKAGAQVRQSSAPSWQFEGGAFWQWIPGSNSYLEGENRENKAIRQSAGASLKGSFSFAPSSALGRLYPGAYQGLGLDFRSFFADKLLGSPISVYAFQGAPIVKFSSKAWMSYEWEMGIATGWDKYKASENEDNTCVSTSVTAHISLALKANMMLSPNLRLSAGFRACHFSNGNTKWPNDGVNALGFSMGLAYIFNPQEIKSPFSDWQYDNGYAPHRNWTLDFLAYGAWRRQVVDIYDERELCPGKFGVAGFSVAPMWRFRPWLLAGVSLDMQWDEGCGLEPYWVEGTSGDDMKFVRPPFRKQLSAGLSLRGEIVMPVFSVNAGIGYQPLAPDGVKKFYQTLNLKTFIYKGMYLNVGYRLGKFKHPQNLILGVGYRL